jgi:hypothetical protein
MAYGITMSGKPQKMPSKTRLRALLSKHSVSAAAAILGCNRSSVRLWGLQYGLLNHERPYSYEIPSGKTLRQLSVRLTDGELADKFGCSEQTIRSHRHAAGIFRSRARRRYTLDEAFFERVDTEQKAYILGFLAADGTIPSAGRSVVLMLQERDVHILRDIRKAMDSNARIFERPIDPRFPHRGPYKFIYFGSQKMVSDLIALGVTPRKSFTLKYPSLPRRMERHFIRGLLDGDGSVKPTSFCFLGTEALIDGLSAAITWHTGVRLTKAHQENKLWRLTGSKRSKDVLSWIYDDASIFLRRKHRTFLEHWA